MIDDIIKMLLVLVGALMDTHTHTHEKHPHSHLVTLLQSVCAPHYFALFLCPSSVISICTRVCLCMCVFGWHIADFVESVYSGTSTELPWSSHTDREKELAQWPRHLSINQGATWTASLCLCLSSLIKYFRSEKGSLQFDCRFCSLFVFGFWFVLFHLIRLLPL